MSEGSFDDGDDEDRGSGGFGGGGGGADSYDSEVGSLTEASEEGEEKRNDEDGDEVDELYSSHDESSSASDNSRSSGGTIHLRDEAGRLSGQSMANPEENSNFFGESPEDVGFMKEHEILFKGQVDHMGIGMGDGPSNLSFTSTKSSNYKNMTHKEASIKFGTCLYKAKKCLESVKGFDSKDYDNQRFYYHKCVELYKRALPCAWTAEEKGRVHFNMGDIFIKLAGVQFESEFRGKFLGRAAKQFGKCLQYAPDGHFVEEIQREQIKIQRFIVLKIKERTDDLEVLQIIFENLQDSVPRELEDLRQFVGEELFEIYFKLAGEVDNRTGEKSTSLKYLQMCQHQSILLNGIEDSIVQNKINEIKKSIRRREKDTKLKLAHEYEHKGDLLVCKGLYQKAANKYLKSIEFSKDECPETEAGTQLKLGKLYFERIKDYNSARNHLVDFQLLTFVVKVRTDEISIGFRQAVEMMRTINKQFKAIKKPKYTQIIKEQQQNYVDNALKEINEMQKGFGKNVQAFVDFVFTNYPPKCHQVVEEIANLAACFENPKKIRKALLKVISYYHPDKQPLEDEINLKISGEIAKHLNNYLSSQL